MTSARAYTIATICALLDDMPRSTFYVLKRAGRLPFLDECWPRLGRTIRYRAEPIDRYLANRPVATARTFFATARRRTA
jgi:hypothetical protein